MHVRRLRMTYRGKDVLAARLAVGRLLSSADLKPSGISPSAVLIVRRMADPLPGRLSPHWHAVRVDAAWERAARDALSALYRRAARPNRGYIPSGAEAVLFADEGEMLACLALDAALGRARERWWWRTILSGVPSPLLDGLTRLLRERAASVPAALHHLVTWGQAVRVLDGLSPGQARAILEAMARAFNVPDLRLGSTFLSERPTADRGGVGGERSAARTDDAEVLLSVQPPGGRRDGVVARTPPPWGGDLTPPGLEKTRDCLLGVGLSLYRRPAMVRSEAFLRALVAWWETPVATPGLRREPPVGRWKVSDEEGSSWMDRMEAVPGARTRARAAPLQSAGEVPPPGFPPSKTGDVQSAGIDRRRVERTPERGPAGRWGERVSGQRSAAREVERSAIVESRPVDEGRVEVVADGARSRQVTSAQSPREGLAGIGERPTAAGPDLGQARQPLEPVDRPERETSDAPVAAASIDLEGGFYTELGGVLYLINLMAYLDLPACFEEDWELESHVGSWGVLELLGRGLLTWEDVKCEEDPLWAALARLDGREPGELPGMGFSGGRRYCLPLGWFAGLDGDEEGGYCYAARRGRLRLWIEAVATSDRDSHGDENTPRCRANCQFAHHTFGEACCVLADVPRDGAPPKTLAEAELRRYLDAAAPNVLRAAFDRAPLAYLDGPLVAGLNPHLARWLALVLPAVRLRLYRALNPPADAAWHLADTLLRRPGRLYITSTHVDLVMGLDAISLPARLAGLDCNPGWMADLGRVVSFHFE